MKDKDEKEFKKLFDKLIGLMTETLRKQDAIVRVWTDNLSNLPFVCMYELEEEDILDDVVFKGVIEPWSDLADEFLPEEDKYWKRAYFSFYHSNYATMAYAPHHQEEREMKMFIGTWPEIAGIMIGFIKVRTCDIPEMPKNLQEIQQKN